MGILDFSDLQDFLVSVNVLLIYVNLFSLFGAAFVSKLKSSPFVAILCMTASNALSSSAAIEMTSMFDSHKDIIVHLWYLGFATIDLITIAAIMAAHKYFNLHYSKLSITVMTSFAVLATLQMTEYIPRIVFDLNKAQVESLPVIPFLYSYGITVTNILVATLVSAVVLLAVLKRVKGVADV